MRRTMVLASLLVAGCGGGGGSSSPSTASTSPPTTTPTTTPSPTTPPTSGDSVTTSPGSVPAGYTVRLARDFGVVCDGVVDDTAALQAALNEVKSYEALQLPAGTCLTSNQLLLSGKSNVIVMGAGKDSTTLSAKDPQHSAFIVYQGSGVTVQDFQVYSPNTTQRLDAGEARGFYVTNSTGVVLNRIKVRNVAAAGVALWVVANSKILNSEALDTRADSFHITGSSSDITVQSNVARNAGDDSFSSIGYAGEDLHDISFLDNESYDGWWGSGVSFEGTRRGIAQRNKVYRSGAAGLRVASNSAYASSPSDDIEMSNNYLEDCVTRADLIDAHGAILVFTDNNYIHNVRLLNNTIKNTASHMGLRLSGLNGTYDANATATSNTMLNTTGALKTPFSVGDYAILTKSGNTLNGAPI
jgi:hypothetical protein